MRSFILMATALLPLAAGAQAMKPLVVIRFNQDHLYYDQQLYSAIAKAASVKPDVLFDVVAYAPQTGNAAADRQWSLIAVRDAQGVIASMQQIGVPLSRIQFISQVQPGLRYDETHIYAH